MGLRAAQRSADDFGQQHLALLATLAGYGQLHPVIALDYVRPGQVDCLGDAQASAA